MKKWVIPLSILLLISVGCNVEKWNEHKVLPLTVALPIDTDTFTVQEIIDSTKPQNISIQGDTIFYGEDTLITNSYFAEDSTFRASFGHGLPDIIDTVNSYMGSTLDEVRGLMHFKGNVVRPLDLSFVVKYYKSGVEISRDSSLVQLSAGYKDTTVYLTLRDVPIGPFSIELKGVGALGAAQIDTLYLAYSVPSRINFLGDTIVLKEDTLEVDSSIIDFAKDSLIDTVELFFRALNGIPAGVRLDLWILNKEKTDSTNILGVNLESADVNGSGFAVGEKENIQHIVLGSRVYDFITQDTLYLHVKTIVQRQSRTVQFRPSDRVSYNAYFRIKGKVDFEKLKD